MRKLFSQWKKDNIGVNIPSALEFRRDQYGLSQQEMADILGIEASHYSEIIHGKRELPKAAMCRAYDIGVPASVLLQKP